MMVRVNYLGPLRAVTGVDEEDVEFGEHARLGDLFERLGEKYGPEFVRHLFDATGDVKEVTLILINGRTLRKHEEFLGQFLSERDVLSILPLYSGG